MDCHQYPGSISSCAKATKVVACRHELLHKIYWGISGVQDHDRESPTFLFETNNL